jgi:beta-phosphoglucomutase
MTSYVKCAAIWDVDGTLVDTAELHFQAWAVVAREMGKPFTRADFTATFGRRNPEIIHQLFDAHLSEAEMLRLADRKEELYRAEAAKGVALLPGVQALLSGLQAAGWRQAVGSSAPRRNLDLILRITDTARYFDAVLSMEDTRRGKPDPEIFLNAAARVNVPPSFCVVFEDAVAGVEAAKAGGMRCVAVRFVGHHPEEKLRKAGADIVVANLEELSVRDIEELVQD